jgi:hypothetical protein
MSVETRTGTYHAADFISDVKAILADQGVTDAGLARIGELMQRLTGRDDLYPGVTHAGITDEHPVKVLHRERMARSRFRSPGSPPTSQPASTTTTPGASPASTRASTCT